MKPTSESSGKTAPGASCSSSPCAQSYTSFGWMQRSETGPPLESAQEPTEIADLLLSLTWATRGSLDESDRELLSSHLAPEKPFVVRVAAAIGLAQVEIDAPVLSVLLDVAADVNALERIGTHWKHLAPTALLALRKNGHEERDEVVPAPTAS